MKKNGRKTVEKPLKRKLHSIQAYCIEEDKQRIILLAKEHSLSVSDFIIKKCLDRRMVENRIETLATINSLVLELSRAGNNINQLTKHANRIKNVDGLDSGMLYNMTILLGDHLDKMEALKKSVKGIYRELGK